MLEPIKEEKWGENGRHDDQFKDLSFVKSLVGKNGLFMAVHDGMQWSGKVLSLSWDKEHEAHVLDIKGDEDTQEEGYLPVWEIYYFRLTAASEEPKSNIQTKLRAMGLSGNCIGNLYPHQIEMLKKLKKRGRDCEIWLPKGLGKGMVAVENTQVTFEKPDIEVHPDLQERWGEHGEKLKIPEGGIKIWGQEPIKKPK
jgi:hypothetical protein